MSKQTNFQKAFCALANYGEDLIKNGYAIVPIAVGKKGPVLDNWRLVKSTKSKLREWLETDHASDGVGIATKDTPAVDLDIRDEELVLRVEAKAREILGDAPMRIGAPPKRVLLYRADEPFKKMRSHKYIDDSDFPELHQIEILGDGQQVVAFHMHPDTKKPYIWPNDDGPDVTPADELQVITAEQCQELIDWFQNLVAEEYPGWTIHKKARNLQDGADIDLDDPFIEDTHPVDMTSEDLRAKLLLVDNEDYDVWFHVGMALYHQFDGEEEGLEMWHEWSETANSYEPEVLDAKWNTFGIDGKKRAPLTARYILKLAKEALDDKADELQVKLVDAFKEAKTLADWNKARDLTRHAEIDGLIRLSIAAVAKDRRDAITNTKVPLAEIKKALAYQPSKTENTPGWCEPYVYDTSDDKFYNTEKKVSATQQGFNAMFDRKALTKKDVLDGKTSPTSSASQLALNLYRIKVVDGRRYEPGKDPIFMAPDGIYANTYPEHEIPELPEKLLPRDKRAINRVKDHVRHLLADKRERRLFVDWLSWVVQNPGRHANWAIVLQGVQGDGKSFFGFLLRAVMGVSNVRMLNAHIFESGFTDWTIGQCVTCVEEVRLIKHQNKYEILNRIKPFITNNVIEVHPKGKAPHDATNTTSYLLFSNYQDCLPLDDNERRYGVFFSRWQRGADLAKFVDENPDYYELLYETLVTSAPALRKWLLEHEQADDFRPLGNAPDTLARRQMIRAAQPEFIQQLLELIADEQNPLISEKLLDVGLMNERFFDLGMETPHAKAFNSMMSRHGFDSLGKVRIDGNLRIFYSRDPDSFRFQDIDGLKKTDTHKIRDYLRKHEPDEF